MEKANNICSANTQFERHKSLGKASNSLEKWQTLQKKIFQRDPTRLCRISVGCVGSVSDPTHLCRLVSDVSDPTHLCRIGVGWCRMCQIGVGSDTFVSASVGWCRMCRIGVGSDTFVSDWCRIGVGSVSAGVGCVG